MKKIIMAGIVTAVLVVFSRQTEATVLIHKTFNDLVREADLILAGTVTDKRSVWAEDNSTIYTFVTLSNLEVIDGDYAQPTFTLRLEGGEVLNQDTKKGRGLKIPGVPEFIVGEKVAAFIKDNTFEVCPLVGWHQGVLRVKKDLAAGDEVLHSFSQDDVVLGPDDEGNFLAKSQRLESEQPSGVQVEEDDPKAKALRLKENETQKQKIASLHPLTLQALKGLVVSAAGKLRAEGKKEGKIPQSADVKSHRKGRGKGDAQTPPKAAR